MDPLQQVKLARERIKDLAKKLALNCTEKEFCHFILEYTYIYMQIDVEQIDQNSLDMLIEDLARQSMEKIATQEDAQVRQVDPPDCKNNSAAQTQKILLQIGLLKDMDVKVSPDLLAQAKTLRELALTIYPFFKAKNN